MTTGAPVQRGPLSSGQTVGGRYRVQRALGDGAQGVVYLATRDDGMPVALKVLHRHHCGDPNIGKRFHREATILKRLEGEHLVKLLDFIEEEGLLSIALEYVDGTSLEEVLKREKTFAPKKAIEVTLQVCAALGCAHAAAIVHRDLKPANVLLERPGGPISSGPESTGVRVRVVDFGLAKVVHGEHMTTGLTEHDMIFGTPEYMAPEQAKGEEADHRADLYAAGVMLYEMIVGKPPFSGRTPLAAMTAHLVEDVPSPRSLTPIGVVSPALEAVIRRALAKSPADRYGSARELAEALAAARDDTKVVAAVSGPSAVVIATSDTDLDVLGSAQLASMQTLPADGSMRIGKSLEESIRAREKELASKPPAPPVSLPATSSAPPTKPSAQGAPASKPAPLAIESPDTEGDPLARPPKSRGWIWAAVAVVFALVGVAIGAIVGAR